LPALFSLKTAVDLKTMDSKTERASNVTSRLGFMSARVKLKTAQHLTRETPTFFAAHGNVFLGAIILC
jgi:hypothetical protein